MDQILHQLGGLFIGSVPTIVFFLLLVIAYGVLVRGPLDRVLAERRARTIGAVEQARGAMGAAEAETAVFEDKLRSARTEIFQAREAKLKQWGAERDQALEQARAATQDRVRAARTEIDASMITARDQMEAISNELSARIIRAVLPAGVRVPGEPGSEVAQ